MLKLCASNLAWGAERDAEMHAFLQRLGFSGLEIAPTRLFPEAPYARNAEAAAFSRRLFEEYGLRVCSLQSIWYGRKERILESAAAREALAEYTKRAIDFSHAASCPTLVFGCPKNRRVEPGEDAARMTDFFRALGAYAQACGAVLALEPNPPVYGTNFLNTPEETAAYVSEAGCAGLRMNLDTGAMLYYDTPSLFMAAHASQIAHIHISETGLAPIEARPMHEALLRAATEAGYGGYVSIETANHGPEAIRRACGYLLELAKRRSGAGEAQGEG